MQDAGVLTLLEHTRKQATRFDWHILERSSRRLTPNSAHRDAKQRPYGQKLGIGIDKAGRKLKDTDQDQVAHQGPLAAVPIGEDAKNDGTEGAEEESKGDGGGDVGSGLAELCGERGDSERDGKVVVAVTSPGEPS